MTERLGGRGALVVLMLVGLVYSGFIKGSSLLAGLPVDLTLACVVLTTLALLVAVLARPRQVRDALPVLGLAAVFLLGVWDVQTDYGVTKVYQFYFISLAAMLGPVLLLGSAARKRAWVVAQILAGLILSAYALLSPRGAAYSTSGAQALVIDGGNTIATGRAAGVAVVGLLILALGGSGKRRVLFALLGLADVYVLLNSGSRGPVAAAAAAVAVVALTAPGASKSRVLRVAAVGVILVGGYYLVRGDTSGGAGRVASTLLAGDFADSSSTTRLTIWGDATRFIATHPLGGGWGAFSYPQDQFTLLGSFGLRYPHNLLLEVTGEAGWLAGIALTAFTVFALRRMRRAAEEPYTAVLLGIAVFAVLNALVSSTLDDRLVWASLSVGWAVPLAPKPGRLRRSRKPKVTSPAVESTVPLGATGTREQINSVGGPGRLNSEPTQVRGH